MQGSNHGGLRDDGRTGSENDELRRLRRENHQLRTERDVLPEAAAWFATKRYDVFPDFRFMTVNQSMCPNEMMAKRPGVVHNGFYAWTNQSPSTR